MSQWMKWIAPAAILVLMVGLQNSQAQDQTMEGKATITVTVVDAAGKPVVGATVRLVPGGKNGKAKGAATRPVGDQAPGRRATPLQTGTTGADGKVALTKIADGAYGVTANMRGEGNGREKVIVAEGKDEAVSITLKAKANKPPAN